MAECHRCGRETDRWTLVDEPLCAECAEWPRRMRRRETLNL